MIDLKLLEKLFQETSDKILWSYVSQEKPIPMRPIVTQNDARNGYIDRYFVRLTNVNSTVTEVDKNQYNSFKDNPRYVAIKIKWKIIGRKETIRTPSGILDEGVADINKNIVLKADLTIKGIRSYIIDYLEFWQAEK